MVCISECVKSYFVMILKSLVHRDSLQQNTAHQMYSSRGELGCMTDTFLNVVQANMSAPRKKRAVEEEMETLEQKEGEEEKNNEFDDEDEMEDESDGSDAEMPNQVWTYQVTICQTESWLAM